MREVHRILREMTEGCGRRPRAIRETHAAMSQMDLLFAKARLRVDFDCVDSDVSAEGRALHLTNARHPLLQDVLKTAEEEVVPLIADAGRTTARC